MPFFYVPIYCSYLKGKKTVEVILKIMEYEKKDFVNRIKPPTNKKKRTRHKKNMR